MSNGFDSSISFSLSLRQIVEVAVWNFKRCNIDLPGPIEGPFDESTVAQAMICTPSIDFRIGELAVASLHLMPWDQRISGFWEWDAWRRPPSVLLALVLCASAAQLSGSTFEDPAYLLEMGSHELDAEAVLRTLYQPQRTGFEAVAQENFGSWWTPGS